jgi:hypothetical protein
MKTLSPTQIETFARAPRQWWYRWVEGHKTPQGPSQAQGEAGHALLEEYFHGRPLPKRAMMRTAVQRAIDAWPGWLLTVPPDAKIEWRLDGTGSNWPTPPNLDTTLHVAGVPVDGFVDLAWPGVIIDHKFISPTSQTFDGPSLQMSLYALRMQKVYPDVNEWALYHHYVYKSKDAPKLVRREFIDPTPVVEKMKSCTSLPGRCLSACNDYGGCKYQELCAVPDVVVPAAALSSDEEDLFK